MLKHNKKVQILPLVIAFLLITGSLAVLHGQEQRWIRVGDTQCYFRDYGCEPEEDIDFLTWPTLYGDRQYTTRQKGFWMGATDFNDPVENKFKSVKVIGAGPRLSDNQLTMIFPLSIQLIGRYYHPTVVVDGQIGTNNTLYDDLDVLDENLICDRMVVSKFNTSLGVSVTRKIMAFTQQNHDDYFIHDYVLTNTGIYNKAGDIYEQTLNEFWAYFTYRYAFSGVTTEGYGATWGSFGSEWGSSTLVHNFTENDPEGFTGYYAWYGPTNGWGHTLTPAEDWGCPDHEETGVLGSAKYTGGTVLFASKNPQNYDVNDPNQPATTAYTGSDGTPMEAAVSQYNESFMQGRYDIMSEGHLDQSMADAFFQDLGNDAYVDDWVSTATYRNTNSTGSASQGQGFGPYTLAPGDSIHIVFVEGVSGISWEKCREVGANWYAYFRDLPNKPELIMPDGSEASDNNEYGYEAYNAYKRAWCDTGADSVVQMLLNAKSNYESGYNIPQPPPAPDQFTIQSGGDRIRLSWSDNAASWPNFDGYVIYRSEGSVKDYKTVYEKLWECDASNVTHTYDDTSAARGFNYYYYIQSRDDGSTNDIHPGVPLYSSKFLTLTTVAAYLRRPAGTSIEEVRVVPNPYDIRARALQFGDDFQYDRIAFYGLPPVCDVKVFTERGDLIWQKYHDDGSGDELWDSLTSSGQIIVSGIYLLYVEATEDVFATQDMRASHDIVADNGDILFHKDELMYTQGEQIFSKGESIYRKFVVIR